MNKLVFVCFFLSQRPWYHGEGKEGGEREQQSNIILRWPLDGSNIHVVAQNPT